MEDSPSACRLPDRVTRAQIRAAIRHPVVACSRKTRPDNCPVRVPLTHLHLCLRWSGPQSRETRGAEAGCAQRRLNTGQGVRQQTTETHLGRIDTCRGFSGSGRTREAAPSAARVAAGRARSLWCAGSLGRCWVLRGPGSAFAVAGRGCATRGLRRGGRRVGVLRRPPTARGGWRRGLPGSGCSTFPRVPAGTGPR